MVEKVNVKVNDRHFKQQLSVGSTVLDKENPQLVEKNTTVENALDAGTLIKVEEKGEVKSENDGSDDVEDVEVDSMKFEDDEDSKDVEDMSYGELQAWASEQDDVSGNQPKDKLVEAYREKELKTKEDDS